MKRVEAKFTVSLASAGNPDHGQFFEAGILSPGVREQCASIAECQSAGRAYIQDHGLGAGNWIGGEVAHDGRRGRGPLVCEWRPPGRGFRPGRA
jgi:hypothetical protein